MSVTHNQGVCSEVSWWKQLFVEKLLRSCWEPSQWILFLCTVTATAQTGAATSFSVLSLLTRFILEAAVFSSQVPKAQCPTPSGSCCQTSAPLAFSISSPLPPIYPFWAIPSLGVCLREDFPLVPHLCFASPAADKSVPFLWTLPFLLFQSLPLSFPCPPPSSVLSPKSMRLKPLVQFTLPRFLAFNSEGFPSPFLPLHPPSASSQLPPPCPVFPVLWRGPVSPSVSLWGNSGGWLAGCKDDEFNDFTSTQWLCSTISQENNLVLSTPP